MKNVPVTLSIDGIDYVRKSAQAPCGPESVIRTYSAGVHIGEVVKQDGKRVELKNARRLYSWAGAFTLNAVATKGVDRSRSRISCPVPNIILTEAIEIIPVAADVDLSSTEK